MLRLQRLRFRRLEHLFSFRRRRRAGKSLEGDTSSIHEDKPEEAMTRVKRPCKPALRCFSYDEIHAATDGFRRDNLVGRGGCSEVYRGMLEDGQAIAVKRLTRTTMDGQKEKDFLTELGTVGHVIHPNVSALLGFCIDRELHLIFELSSRGSVSSNLHDENSPPMTWKRRHNIALGTARGLHHLHKECQRRIIHRDINASNILLTSNYEPQISDFGLAKWLPSERSHRAIGPIEGTFGCLAPEYFTHGIVDEKTDVFAFGVFLLEIISGRKPVDGSHTSLLSWVKPYLSDGTAKTLVDPRLGDDYDVEQLTRLTFAASLCIRAAATWRPSMTEVLELLEGGEISHDRWKMREEDGEVQKSWGFDYLDDDDEDGDDESDTSWTYSTTSSQLELVVGEFADVS